MSRYATDMASLAGEFKECFQDVAAMQKDLLLFTSPFSMDPDDAPHQLQLELIELQCDNEWRCRQQQFSLLLAAG